MPTHKLLLCYYVLLCCGSIWFALSAIRTWWQSVAGGSRALRWLLAAGLAGADCMTYCCLRVGTSHPAPGSWPGSSFVQVRGADEGRWLTKFMSVRNLFCISFSRGTWLQARSMSAFINRDHHKSGMKKYILASSFLLTPSENLCFSPVCLLSVCLPHKHINGSPESLKIWCMSISVVIWFWDFCYTNHQ